MRLTTTRVSRPVAIQNEVPLPLVAFNCRQGYLITNHSGNQTALARSRIPIGFLMDLEKERSQQETGSQTDH